MASSGLMEYLSITLGPPSRQHGRKRKRIKIKKGNDGTYVYQDPSLIKPDFVVIDPNKRDLLYCLGSNDQKLRYTQPQRAKETRRKKYARILQSLDRPDQNYGHSRTTVDAAEFDLYLTSYFLDFERREDHYRNNVYRKLRLNTFINTQKTESKFIDKFKETYGGCERVSVIFGDWSPRGITFRGQECTKGKGFRKMFQRNGYEVFLLDEYRTSKVCPGCDGPVETFKRRRSPKPWKTNEVIVHGLLRCQSDVCQQSCGHPSRLWNRDDVATLNQRRIVRSMIEGRGRAAGVL